MFKVMLVSIFVILSACPFHLHAGACLSAESVSEISGKLAVDFMGFQICGGSGVIFEGDGVSFEVACEKNPSANPKKGWRRISSPDGGFYARCVSTSQEPPPLYFKCCDLVRRLSNEGISNPAQCSHADAIYLGEIASRLLSEGDPSSAEAFSRRGIAADPGHLPNYLLLGRALLGRGVHEDDVVSELLKLGSKAPYSADIEAMLTRLSRMGLK